MDFNYIIFSDLQLIIESYVGNFNYTDIFECKKTEIKDPQWNDYYNVLGDIRKGNMRLTSNDISSMNEYFKKNQELNSNRKSAILTNSPDQVVFGTLLNGYNTIKGSLVVPKVFSTLDSAISWLCIKHTEHNRIKDALEKLSEN